MGRMARPKTPPRIAGLHSVERPGIGPSVGHAAQYEASASRTSQVCGQPFPLIAGPGALASILILTSEARGEPTAFALVLVAAAIVLIVAYVFLRASARLARLLGQTGINVVTRVLGLLLAALAVQYVADGVVELKFSLGA